MYHEAASLFYNTNEFSVNLVLKGNRDAYNIPEATYCCANAPWVEGAMRFQAGTIRLFLSLSFPDEEECSLLSCFFYSIANALHSGYSKYGHHCGIDLIIDWRAAETPMLQFASAQDRAKTIRRWNRARSAVESLLWEFLSIAPEGCINTYTAFVSFVWDKGPAFSHPYERFRPIYLKENLEEGNIVFRSWSGDGEKPPDGIEGVFDELATF